MAKITQIDKSVCKSLAAEIEQALKDVAEKHGLAISYRGGSFTASTFSPKIEFAVVDESGAVLSREAEDFKRNAVFLGLKAEHLGASFTQGGRTFTICGLKTRAGRLPILATCGDKTYKFNAADVARALNYKPEHTAPAQ